MLVIHAHIYVLWHQCIRDTFDSGLSKKIRINKFSFEWGFFLCGYE